MRIYYFGELIEENGVKVSNSESTEAEERQTQLNFEAPEKQTNDRQKIGMPSVGDLLKDIDLNLDVYRPLRPIRGV